MPNITKTKNAIDHRSHLFELSLLFRIKSRRRSYLISVISGASVKASIAKTPIMEITTQMRYIRLLRF